MRHATDPATRKITSRRCLEISKRDSGLCGLLSLVLEVADLIEHRGRVGISHLWCRLVSRLFLHEPQRRLRQRYFNDITHRMRVESLNVGHSTRCPLVTVSMPLQIKRTLSGTNCLDAALRNASEWCDSVFIDWELVQGDDEITS